MTTTKDLLTRGYFPKELPPLFTTASLGKHYAALNKSGQQSSYCLRYSYSKYSSLRRALSIPNPAHFVPLAKEIEANWSDIEAHCKTSPISKTTPKVDSTRALSWSTDLEALPELRAQMRVSARYALQTDIAACYASMYTHAIPWALHTKATAKNNRNSNTLCGNLLDKASRNIQSGQTIGIPIGPDTSLPLGEIILTEVDKIVVAKLNCANSSFRFVDDYEFVFDSYSEAEHARNVLQDALGEFELQLNPRKTRIIELPHSLDTSWVHDLAAFPLDASKSNVLRAQLIRYFSRAFELAKEFPGEPVLKYAVRRLSEVSVKVTGANGSVSELIQKLLFQSAVADPGTLHTALYIAFEHKKKSLPMANDSILQAISAIVCRHSALQHGGDVAWALWGAVVLGLRLEDKVVSALESLTDPIAILMSLFAESNNILGRSLDKSRWNTMVTATELFESRWLIAYEGVGHNWLLAQNGDPAVTDPFFASARQRGIKFIDENTILSIPSPSPIGDYN